jgi:DNA (cytosine-5)-methyltransferase 1
MEKGKFHPMNYIPHQLTTEQRFSDFYCGAGGSSSGMKKAGLQGIVAANHWALAVETHNTNHPEMEHRQVDLLISKPSAFPYSDIAWFSPECTWHAKQTRGEKQATSQIDMFAQVNPDPAEERSRVTMWDVVRFTEHHHYQVVMVENVCDIKYWPPYQSWLKAMESLGYNHKICYFNSRFFHTLNGQTNFAPQNRDRWYAVFWRKGNKAPDLDFRPLAYCHGCEMNIKAVQIFKKSVFPLGFYDTTGHRGQYYYGCPTCRVKIDGNPQARRVEPYYFAAYNVIDWSLPCPLIGDRPKNKALKPNTLRRIQIGLDKFGQQPLVVQLARSHDQHSRSITLDSPMPTQTAWQTLAFIVPFKGERAMQPTASSLPTQTGVGMPALVVVPSLVEFYNGGDTRPISDPLNGETAGGIKTGLLMSHYGRDNVVSSLSDPAPTFVADGHQYLVVPFLISYYSRDNVGSPLNEPVPTIPCDNRFALINRAPFITAYNSGSEGNHRVDEPVATLTTNERHALVHPEVKINDCGFRMLTPDECKLGQGFDRDYIILGTRKKDQVRQIGNAVSDPPAEYLGQATAFSLR